MLGSALPVKRMQALCWLVLLLHVVSLSGVQKSNWSLKGIRFSRVRSRSVQVTWSGPKMPNGDIKYYVVLAQDIKTNKTFVVKTVETSVLLSKLEPNTKYRITVIAESSGSHGQGISDDVTTLRLGNEYDVDVKAEATGTDSIHVNWSRPKAYWTQGIRHYDIYLRGPSVLLQGSVQPGTTSYTFKGLPPFTSFTAIVTLVFLDASKPFEHGSASAATWPTVGQNVKDVRFPRIRSRYIEVAWNASDTPYGDIKCYHVQATNVQTGKAVKIESVKTQTTLADLDPNTAYNISVRTENKPLNGKGGGIGQAVTTTVKTLSLGNEYDVDVKAEATGTDSIRVNWSKPTAYGIQGIQRYDIYLRGPSVLLQGSVQPGTTSYTFKGLPPFTSFTAIVTLVFLDVSKPSEIGSASATTWPTVGQEVRNVHFKNVTSNSVETSWSEPTHPQGVIDKYHVEVRDEGETMKQTLTTISTNITLIGLQPSTAYNVSVSTENQQRNGNGGGIGKAVSAKVTTLETDNKVSTNIWFPHVRSRLVLVTWIGQQSTVGNIKEYRVVARDLKGNKSLEFKTARTNALLYILEPETKYLITVNAEGQGSDRVGEVISGEVTTWKLDNDYDVDVQAEAIGTNSIVVNWKRPKAYNTHDIRHYSLYIAESSVAPKAFEQPNAAHFAEPDATTYTFQSLSPSTSYTVVVKLVPSDSSKFSEFGLASATTRPIDNKVSTNIWFPHVRSRLVLVTWIGQQSTVGNIKEYRVVARDLKGNKSLEFKTARTNALLYILEPETKYLITVNAEGQGSDRVGEVISGEVTTWKLDNDYDVDVQAEAIGTNSIVVNWKRPKAYNTHDIRHYSLYIAESSVAPKAFEQPNAAHFAEPDATTYTFQSLSPSTSYTVVVKLVPSDSSKFSEFGLASATTRPIDRPACGVQKMTPSAWNARQTSRHEATPHSWPWAVGLYASIRGGYPYCGGTLIGPEWVITAAHCVEMAMNCIPIPDDKPFSYKALTNATLFVRIGDHSLARTETFERDYFVQNIIMHPNYRGRSGSSENDIALLHLEKAVVADTAVGFICLPNSDSIVNTSKECAYAGWGSISQSSIIGHQNAPVLMEGSVTIKSQDFCKSPLQGPKSEGQACLATRTGNPCWGDSGAGIYCTGVEGGWFLYGILNRGDFLCGGPFATSTKVFPYLDWISKLIAPNAVL